MRIIGIDPGLRKTGIGIVDLVQKQLTPVFFETLTIPTSLTRPKKIQRIHEGISQAISEFHPDVLALEDVFYAKNVRVTLRLGEARSAALLAAAENELEVFEYLPTRVKQSICGNGRGAKQQVQMMIRHILSLKETPEEDAADALAIAICHSQTTSLQVQ